MTAPLDLDALEAAARAATQDWRRSRAFGQLNVQNDKYMLSDADAIYAAAASPAVMQTLIDRLRLAESDAKTAVKLCGELRELNDMQRQQYASAFSPVRPTMEGQIMMAFSTMRNGQIYHAVEQINPHDLMLARDKGVAQIKYKAVYLMAQILGPGALDMEAFHAHS